MYHRENRQRILFSSHFVYAALGAIVLISGCGKGGGGGDGHGGGPAGGPPPAPPVTVAAALEREVTEYDEFSGRLEAVERVELRPRVSGYINKVNFRQGAEVRKGDLLFEIDPNPFLQEVRRGEAELNRAKTRFDLAASEFSRVEKLIDSGAISRQEFDQNASAKRESEAAVRSAQAALESARLNLGYTKVRAPVSGLTSRAELTVGNWVTAGQSVLTTVVSLDPIYATFEADEQAFLKYVDLARRGERASSRTTRNPIFMELANETGFPHKGYVDFVDNRLNPATGTILARAVFDNKQRRFTPGLFARLKFVGSGTYRAVLIEDRAVGTDQDKKFVLVVGADNKTAYRPVKLGPLIDGLRSVKDGLKAGELIVVNGLQRVRPGMPVAPEKVVMGAEQQQAKPGAPAATAAAAPTAPPPAPAETKPVEGKKPAAEGKKK